MQVQKSRRTPTRSAKPATRARTARGFERRNLVADHVGLVHHVARQLASRLSTEAELDELVSAGSLGLMQAAEAFEPARGLSFSTFAVPRIRGAMLDELRRVDPMPRNVRRRTREVARARDVLSASLHRAPTASEVAGHLAVPSDQVHRWEFDAHTTNVVSFHQPARVEADTTLGDLLADDRATSVDDLLTHEVEVEALKRAILTLKEQERTVLALNYFEELKLQEIADVLQLSVCRISQIRTAALEKLRVALSELRAA
jgi:RNA polymerase sigma factor for flagellar operon FliA